MYMKWVFNQIKSTMELRPAGSDGTALLMRWPPMTIILWCAISASYSDALAASYIHSSFHNRTMSYRILRTPYGAAVTDKSPLWTVCQVKWCIRWTRRLIFHQTYNINTRILIVCIYNIRMSRDTASYQGNRFSNKLFGIRLSLLPAYRTTSVHINSIY